MRVKLISGKQSALINAAKKQCSVSDSILARRLRISKRQLFSWKRGKTQTIPLVAYSKLCKMAETDYKKEIEQYLTDHWAAGKAAESKQVKINNPEKSEKLAEFVGIHLGDGNIYVKKGLVYQMRIAGDHREEKQYMLEYVKPLVTYLFGVVPHIKFLKNNCIHVCVNSKPLYEFFLSIGIKPGNKMKTRQSIPKWIFENNSFVAACVRGLIDTDGSIHRLSNRDPKLLRICFKNANTRLSKDMRKALLVLGFHPSKITNRNIFLTRKEDIKRYTEKIKFNNPKHIARLKKFSPVV